MTLLALAVLVVLTGSEAALSTETGGGAARQATPEALLVRGISSFDGRGMSEGLAQIERAYDLRPDWELARRSLAYALVRTGQFEKAAGLLEELVGRGIADGLSSGELTGRGLTDIAAPDDVLALAIARGETGAHREADRLYRSYADLVGSSTPEAARAFKRLADLYERSGVSWGQPDVELRRALALDPDIESKPTLPGFPNPADHAELVPYTLAPTLAPGHDAPEEGYDSLPRPASWTAPPVVASRTPLTRDVEVEVLVGEDGTVLETVLPEDVATNPGQAAAAESAVRAWTFDPAMAVGLPIEAWILLDVEIPLIVAESDTTETEGEPSEAADQSESAEKDTTAPAASEPAARDTTETKEEGS